MDELEIKRKLDDLAEYQAHRDLLDADKRALLNDVTVPTEVQEIVSDGMKQMAEVEAGFKPEEDALAAETKRILDAIVIPEEIRAALAEIDRQRAAAQTAAQEKRRLIADRISAAKDEIRAGVDAKTKDVYDALARRKAEIEAEFAGKAEAVDENIRKLTEEIKAATKELKATVRGQHFMAVYVKGRVSWNNDMLDGMIALVPQLEQARKEGEPSITIRRI